MMKNKRLFSDCEDPYYDCPDDDYLIPVVFHVVQDQSDAFNFPISDAMLEMLIVDLNRIFAGTHPKQTSLDPDFAPLFAGNTGIRFVKAAVDPDGNPHSGIERRATDKAGFRNDHYGPLSPPDVALSPVNSELIIKYEANGGLDAWPRKEFFNIWIGDIYDHESGGGLPASSYATFPQWDLIRPQLSGIVLNMRDFSYPTHLVSMMAAHETGHWLGLIHTFWQNCVTGCAYTSGDLCEDTPTDESGHWTCSSSYCGHKNMNENIMDYSDCRKMFTLEQLKRMKCQMSSYRSTFVLGRSCVGIISSVKFTPEVSTVPVCFGESRSLAVAAHAGYSYEWDVSPAVAVFTVSSPIGNSITLTNISPTYKGEVTVRVRMGLLNPIGTIAPCGTGGWFEHKLWFGGVTNNPVISSMAISTIPNRWSICPTEQSTIFSAAVPGYPTALLPSLTYTWTVTGGGTIHSGAGTDEIVVVWPAPTYTIGTWGTVKVEINNECGGIKSDTDLWARMSCEGPGSGGRMASLSPNPASGQVVVSLKDEIVISPNGLQITVRNSEGAVKLSQISSARQTTLDLSSLQHGFYVVTIQNGEESEDLRLVVE